MTPEQHKQLREPFDPALIGKLPKSGCKACSESRDKHCDRHPWVWNCGICGNHHASSAVHLDFVGHAAATDRLLQVDPDWTWRPFTQEEILALPPSFRDAGLWIMLTICGVTRPGFGDASGKSGPNAVKEAIGDAIRNGAMRFGVALDLWAKEDLHAPAQNDAPAEAPQPPADPALVAAQTKVSETWKAHRGEWDWAAISAEFKEHAGVDIMAATVDDLLGFAAALEVAAQPKALEGTVLP